MTDYALYLDDIRYPPRTGEDWVLCRTVATMLEILHERGLPNLVSFDYELGRTDPGNTGYDAVSEFLDFLIANPPTGEEGSELEVRWHTSSGYGEARMAKLLKERQIACEASGISIRSST
ncbi:cyclic-phosphate processing receiver domain-containing protein [Coraliomargarita sp. W4R72]